MGRVPLAFGDDRALQTHLMA